MSFKNPISRDTKEKFLLYGPYSLRATGLSTAFFMLSLPTGILLAARFTDPAKLNNLIPKSMQFFNVRGLEHMRPQFNAWIYMGLIFATLVTAAAIYTICKMHANSTDIGQHQLLGELLDKTTQQTVLYHDEVNGVHHLMLDKEYPLGCMVKSKSGNKKVMLGKPVEGVHQESTKGCIYPVTSYHNHKDDKEAPENKRTSNDLPKDFFKEEASKSKTTVYELNLTRLNEKLADVYTGQQ